MTSQPVRLPSDEMEIDGGRVKEKQTNDNN